MLKCYKKKQKAKIAQIIENGPSGKDKRAEKVWGMMMMMMVMMIMLMLMVMDIMESGASCKCCQASESCPRIANGAAPASYILLTVMAGLLSMLSFTVLYHSVILSRVIYVVIIKPSIDIKRLVIYSF